MLTSLSWRLQSKSERFRMAANHWRLKSIKEASSVPYIGTLSHDMDNSWNIPGFSWANSYKTDRKVQIWPYESDENLLDHIILSSLSDWIRELNKDIQFNSDTFAKEVKDLAENYFNSVVPSSKDDLTEYLTTSLSNGRKLKWVLMFIPPNLTFSLHAHPNVELIVILEGSMHEYRLKVRWTATC